ncbi:MAG TPA: hypothetical protein VN661_10420 [Candidatus Acidoferrales bacterium]|nr:hypothetical protein [Candidatus Acidoferrales bacterium]
MLRKVALLLGLCLAFSVAANAQLLGGDQVEVFGGYSYMRLRTSPGANMNGWELSGNYKFMNWIGGVVDLDGTYGSGASVHSFLFGPQISFPARISPFAHVLFGGAHFSSGPVHDTSFAVGVGVGIDARIVPGIAWRVIEGDYVPTHFFGQTQNNGRLATGIVLRF